MVRNVLGILAGGGTIDDVLADFPELSREGIISALEYAADVVDGLGRAQAGTTASADPPRPA